MRDSIQKAAWTFVALAALFSGVACQTHVVVAPDPAIGAHPGASEHAHHAPGSHSSGETEPEDACCVPWISDTPPGASNDSISQAIMLTVVLDAPVALLRSHPVPTPNHKPPGSSRPLDQTSILLI